MRNETTRAGAHPAGTAPRPAQPETQTGTVMGVITAQLVDNLKRGMRLLDVCEIAAIEPGSQGTAAMQAAARILRGQTEAVAAIARIACGETRHRTIVEYVNGSNGRLNSNFSDAPPPPSNGKARPANGKSPR